MYYSSSKPVPSQEQKHIKLLKQMMQKEGNKNCFECNQRGPTYVDVTIGSFVCSSCGGILRGLNNPHRVKSISMASFTPSEIALVEIKGNDYCKSIYMGNYDKDPPKAKPNFQDPVKIKMFMEQKYDKKRWYVSPQDVNKPLDSFMKSVNSNNKATSVQSNSITTVSSAPDATKKQVHGDKSSISTGSSNNVTSLTSNSAKPEATDAGFANFNQAFPSQNFDPFGSFMSGQTSASSADSAHTTTAFGDFSKTFTPSSTSLAEDTRTTKSSDKYSDLGDIFKVETSSSEKSTNLWAELENPPAKSIEVSSTPALSSIQQPQNFAGNWQIPSAFINNKVGNLSNSSYAQPALTHHTMQLQQPGTTGINQANFGAFSQASFASTSPTFNLPPSTATTNNQNPYSSFSTIQNTGNAAIAQFQAPQSFAAPTFLNAAPAASNPFELPLNSKQAGNTNPFLSSQTTQNQSLSQPSSGNPFASQTNVSTNSNQLPSNPFF